MHPNGPMSRRRLLQVGGGLGVAGLLAACGGDDDGGGSSSAATSAAAEPSSSAAPATSAAAATSAAESSAAETTAEAPVSTLAPATSASGGGVDLQLDPASEKGALEIFDWQGYEDTAAPFWTYYTDGPYGKSNPLKFTFLENDQQALAKVASGFKTDVTHPCLAYTKNWLDADLIQPWDVAEIPGFDTINPRLYEASIFDDKVYGIPWDWGYVSLVYRADRVDPKEMSWNLLLDERYKGRIGFFTDGVDIIQVGGLINGVSDPNKMSSEEIEAAKQTMLKAKKNIRTFWTNQTEAVQEMVAGNLDITYGWPDAWYNVKAGLPNADVQYLDPVEGRLAWVCGYVLMKDTPRAGLAHQFVSSIPTPENALALMDNYYYGAAGGGSPEVLAQVQEKSLVKTFGLDDLETALAPPKTWLLQYLPNRADYVKAAEEVKAG
jgi:spermidine/putrescine transport system substrate-binding protein